MDHFSTGRLKVLGGPIYSPRRRGPKKAVDEPQTIGSRSCCSMPSRAHRETRELPAAEHAELFDNKPKEILEWYCVWIAPHMEVDGARPSRLGSRPSPLACYWSCPTPTTEAAMTDLETILAMLARANIEFEQLDDELETIVDVEGGDRGFFSEFIFDKAGALVSLRAYG